MAAPHLAQRSSGLIVPPEYADRHPAFRCNVCGCEFPNEQRATYERHVGECARRNMDVIMAERPSERRRGGPFDPESWDPEVEAHMAEVGRQMLREGRLEVKPSERAGF